MKLNLLLGKIPTFWLAAVFLLPSLGTRAQVTKHVVNLFLHLDKAIYQPNETIWFTGYILNRDSVVMQEQNTLYVALVDPVSRTVVSKQRFLIEDGLGKGSLTLPDTVSAGDYWFLAYTNALLEMGDQPVFRQLISVRTGTPAPFSITSAKLEEQNDSLFIRYRISTANRGLASGGKFIYTLFDSTHAIAAGQKIIDEYGYVLLYLGATGDTGKYRGLTATITRGDLSNKFFFPIYTGNFSNPFPNPKNEERKSAANVRITLDTGYSPTRFDASNPPTNFPTQTRIFARIRIRDSAGNPVPGIFSLSVVASKRLGPNQPHSIAYYDQFPETAPSTFSSLKPFAGKMPDYGYVLEDNDRVNKPVSLALIGSQLATFQTDAKGRFALPWAALVTSGSEVNCLSVAANSPDRYKIMVYSRADTFNAQLAAMHYPVTTPNYEVASDPEDIFQVSYVKSLKAAVVKATIKSEFDYGSGYYNSTHCADDYVCTHHHGGPGWPDMLNCPYMVENGPCDKLKPKEGAMYYWVPPSVAHSPAHGVIPIIYHCQVPAVPHFMKVLEPIQKEKPFPAPYNAWGDLLGNGHQSTVYWKHSVTTNSNGEAIVSFFTDELTGNFTCTLQGISSAGVITGSASYTAFPIDITSKSPVEGPTTATTGH